MNRIDAAFDRLKQKGEKALVGFVSAGDPSPSKSLEIIQSMVDAGLDILELGVPFSDPTADGPVIQRSSLRALKAGMSLTRVLEMTRSIRRTSQIPIVIFSYYNPILAYGVERFYQDAVSAGADGLLVVDLPPEESGEMTSAWSGNSLALIRLVAPTTPPERMGSIARSATGFIYLVSMTGVTGSGGIDVEEITRVTGELKALTSVPICVGFGISTSDHVRGVGACADGIVVGSAFERIIEGHLDNPHCARKVGDNVRSLKVATLPA